MIQDSYLPAVQSPCHGLDADWQWFASRVPCWPQERWPLTEEDWIQAEKVSRLCRGCILCYFSVTKPLPGSNDPMIIQLFTDPSHLQSPRVSVQLDVEPAFVYFHKLSTAAWGLAATERLRKENARKLTLATGCEAGACRSGWRTGVCVVLAYLRFLEFFADLLLLNAHQSQPSQKFRSLYRAILSTQATLPPVTAQQDNVAAWVTAEELRHLCVPASHDFSCF